MFFCSINSYSLLPGKIKVQNRMIIWMLDEGWGDVHKLFLKSFFILKNYHTREWYDITKYWEGCMVLMGFLRGIPSTFENWKKSLKDFFVLNSLMNVEKEKNLQIIKCVGWNKCEGWISKSGKISGNIQIWTKVSVPHWIAM